MIHIVQPIYTLASIGNHSCVFYCTKNGNHAASHTLDSLYAMDHITKGIVEIASDTLHGGVWLRIFRTLVEELSSLKKITGTEARNLMVPHWQELDLFVREGLVDILCI